MNKCQNISRLNVIIGWPIGVGQVLRGLWPIKPLLGTNQEALDSESTQKS